ncbi:MAG: patatin-like phospholipase family protein [Clostridia bacterium]|nr:patatin-like phospholipase family protein [Clostridia bacterium]
MEKIGLVLEGGGVKGAYQVGALRAIEEYGISFDGVVGTSIGAVNGALYLEGGYSKLYEMWKDVDTDTIFDIDPKYLRNLKQKDIDLDTLVYVGKCVFSISDILKNTHAKCSAFLTAHVSEEELRKSPLDYGCVTYDLTDRRPIEVMKENVPEGKLVDYIIASATYPALPPKVIDNKKYIDGGVWDNMPVNLIAHKGYKKILVIRTNVKDKQPQRKFDFDPSVEVRYIIPKVDLGKAMAFSHNRVMSFMAKGYGDAIVELDNGLADFLKKE